MKVFLFTALLSLLIVGPAFSQTCAYNTGNNAIIILPSGSYYGLQDDDIVQAYYGDKCVGEKAYIEGKSISITVWGDDMLTESIDGIPSGASIEYRVYRPETSEVVDEILVSYRNGDGLYNANDIEILGSFETNQALPVELTTFNVVADQEAAVLRWETASETNNAGFEIQHLISADSSYKAISFVEGNGTSAEKKQYQHTVKNLEPGTHRFRLKQLDLDGTFDHSAEVEVFIELPEAFRITDAYPNPFNPQTSLTLMLREKEEVTVQVYDVQGRLVRTLYDGDLEPNRSHVLDFDANGLASGLYLIRFLGDTFRETRKATLLK